MFSALNSTIEMLGNEFRQGVDDIARDARRAANQAQAEARRAQVEARRAQAQAQRAQRRAQREAGEFTGHRPSRNTNQRSSTVDDFFGDTFRHFDQIFGIFN